LKKLLIVLLTLLFSCDLVESQIDKKKLFYQLNSSTGSPAISGQATFEMADLGETNLPDLFIDYNLPAGSNLSLLVYLHGWNGGGQIPFDSTTIAYLHSNNIGILGLGMRGRNTAALYANDAATVENWRDASGLEIYDLYASVKYFLANVATAGHVNEEKIFIYGISGGGGNALGAACKIPDMFSLIVDWYGMGKYGNYETDPYTATTSWFTDAAAFYQSSIQKGVNGHSPKSPGTGYIAGTSDMSYVSRDHIRFIRNLNSTIHFYHAPIDGQVDVDLSDNLEDQLIIEGKTYNYYRDNAYDHDHFDLAPTYFDPGVFGLQWLNDAKTLTRTPLPTSGSIYVPGFYISDTRDFEVWIHKYRQNFAQSVWSDQGRFNQGKSYAAEVDYNITNGTYEVTPIFGHNASGDRYFFVRVDHEGINQWAFVAQNDVITMEPKVYGLDPLNLTYDWKVFHDFSNTDSYILDDLSKVSNANDLSDNHNIAFQPTRASRASVVSNYLDNGVLQYSSTSGTLATQYNPIEFSGEFTIVIKFDPYAASVAAVSASNCGLFGRGSGGNSQFYLGTFSGKITANIVMNGGGNILSTSLPSFGPANANLGVQTWVIRRNASNQIKIEMKGDVNSVSYNTASGIFGTLSGTFDLRVLGAASALTKQLDGATYKFAATDEYVSDADVTTILNNF
jgi:hypothetical protein